MNSNNTIFDNNMLSLMKRYPDIYGRIAEAGEAKWSLYVDADDTDAPAMVTDGAYIYQLESRYGNEIFAEHLFSRIPGDWDLNAKYALFGLGVGFYVRYFLDNFSADHKIYVYEPSVDILAKALKYYDYTDIIDDDRVQLYVGYGMDFTEYDDYLTQNLVDTDLNSIAIGTHMNYQRLFKSEYDKWITALDDNLNNRYAARVLYERCGEIFTENNYSNFGYYIKSKAIKELEAALPENVPVIIVSAGPSLSGNIDKLKLAQGKALIIAVDAAINPLVKADIIPDAVINVDPIKGEKYIQALGSVDIPLICELNTCKAFLSNHYGDKFFILSHNTYSNIFLRERSIELPVFEAGGSVANSAYSAAKYLGAKTIIFVGQDLAFTGDQVYASGAVMSEAGKGHLSSQNEKVYYEESVDGGIVKTNSEFRMFRLWFERKIKEDSHIKCIDATEGGALIHGTQLMTLSDAIDTYCVNDFDAKAFWNSAGNIMDEQTGRDYIEYILSLNEKLGSCKDRIRKCLDIYAEVRMLAGRKTLDGSRITSCIKKANSILDAIQADPAMEYPKNICTEQTSEILSRVYKTENDVRKEILSSCEVGEEYVKLLDESVDRVLEIAKCYEDGLKSLL